MYCGKEEKSLLLFSTKFSIYNVLTSGVNLHIHLLNVVFNLFFPQFCKSDVEVQISGSISKSSLDIEIMRAD